MRSHSDRIKHFVETVENLSTDVTDRQLWLIAVLAVILAGERAHATGNENIETACELFVEDMHDFAGTPPLFEKSVH
jgi:hypothetical protein